MDKFFIKIKTEKVEIDKKVFLSLLNISHVKEYSSYKNAITDNEISLSHLKDLSEKADTPYPLFFAPLNIVNKQIKDKENELNQKLPSKKEIRLAFRGKMKSNDIELIVKDLARKQEFLKRILPMTPENSFVGSVSHKIIMGVSNKDIAKNIRDYFKIDLNHIRNIPKDDVLNYLFKKAEKKNILISLSSYHYMPQEISKDLYLSGFCVKDKKFPYIFINTRDGDETPIILETSGRQIFTLIAMIVSIGMNKFVLSMKEGQVKSSSQKRIYSIVGEILIPENDLTIIKINDVDDIKKYAKSFKVTPSMLVMRLKESNFMSRDTANLYLNILYKEIKEIESKKKYYNNTKPVNGFGKYNGERFSHEVVIAHKARKVSLIEAKNILFRKGKMDNTLFNEYINKFK